MIMVPIFQCTQDNFLCGKFWAMGRFNLLGGQSTLLGGHLHVLFTSLGQIVQFVLLEFCVIRIIVLSGAFNTQNQYTGPENQFVLSGF